MTDTRGSFWAWTKRRVGAQFLAGVLVVVPIAAAILILVWVFFTIDNILQPVVVLVSGNPIPGLGFAATLLIIYLAGLIASNVIGRRLIRYGESWLARLPVFRHLYTGIKQILESFSSPQKTGFMQVVLVEFPRPGMSAIGFVTNQSAGEPGRRLLSVFIPTAPNPTAGFLQVIRESEAVRVNVSVDDALKMVVSAGRMSARGIIEHFNPPG